MSATYICTVEGCDKDNRKGAGGLCGMHRQRLLRTGSTGEAGYLQRPGRTLTERVYERLVVNPATGCWEWQGALNNGYGVVGTAPGVFAYVHRWVFEDMNGEIPEGLVIDHLCCNPTCANPEHLDAVTIGVNTARGRATRKAVAA